MVQKVVIIHHIDMILKIENKKDKSTKFGYRISDFFSPYLILICYASLNNSLNNSNSSFFIPFNINNTPM